MQVSTVFQQMTVVLIIMMVGFICRKKSIISADNNRFLSEILLNIFNPCIVISSMLDADIEDRGTFYLSFGLIAGTYILTILAGLLITRLLSKDKIERDIFQLLLVFANVGFIGIPVVKALFGTKYLAYVVIFNFEYDILIYTYGYALIPDMRNGGASAEERKDKRKALLRNIINPGTISCVIAFVIFFFKISLPNVLSISIGYLGDTCVPLSLMIIGANIAQYSFKQIASDPKTYIFCVIKLILLPAFLIFLIKRLPLPEDYLQCIAVMLALPSGTMPQMIALERGVDSKLCSACIVFSTVLSVLTIPLIVYLYPFL